MLLSAAVTLTACGESEVETSLDNLAEPERAAELIRRFAKADERVRSYEGYMDGFMFYMNGKARLYSELSQEDYRAWSKDRHAASGGDIMDAGTRVIDTTLEFGDYVLPDTATDVGTN